MRVFFIIFFGAVLVAVSAAAAAADEVLLFDDFSGGSLDTAKWDVANWTLGPRTQLGVEPLFGSESGIDYVTLRLQTYCPSAPGSKLYGTELYSDALFSAIQGRAFEARIRIRTETPGLVGAFFLYEYYNGTSDETDFEILTNDSVDSILVTNWNDWEEGATAQNDGEHHHNNYRTVEGFDRTQWTVLKMYSLPRETRWLVDGEQIWSDNQAVPDQDMKVHLNFWAPGGSWSRAYSEALQPVSDSGSNQVYYMDVDYVRVSRIDPDTIPAVDALGLFVLAFGMLFGAYFTVRSIRL